MNSSSENKRILHFHFCGTGEKVSINAERLVNKGEYKELVEFQEKIYKEKIQLEMDEKKLKIIDPNNQDLTAKIDENNLVSQNISDILYAIQFSSECSISPPSFLDADSLLNNTSRLVRGTESTSIPEFRKYTRSEHLLENKYRKAVIPALKIAYSEVSLIPSEKDRIRDCLDEINLKNPEIIVITGHSRGASACIEFAREIYLAYGNNIKVHMNIYDPVPGPLRHEETKKVIPPNVQSLVITCAGNEDDIILKVQNMDKLAFDIEKTSATMLVLPTYHTEFPETLKTISEEFWRSIKHDSNTPNLTGYENLAILPQKPQLPLNDNTLYLHRKKDGEIEVYPGNNIPKKLTVSEIEKLTRNKWLSFPGEKDDALIYNRDANESTASFINDIASACGYGQLKKTEILNDADIADRRKQRIYSMTSIAPQTSDNQSIVHFHNNLADAANIPKRIVTMTENISISTNSNKAKSESMLFDERKEELKRIRKEGKGFKNLNMDKIANDLEYAKTEKKEKSKPSQIIQNSTSAIESSLAVNDRHIRHSNEVNTQAAKTDNQKENKPFAFTNKSDTNQNSLFKKAPTTQDVTMNVVSRNSKTPKT